MQGSSQTSRSRTQRPTVALLVSELERAYQGPIWRAVSERARELGINLFCYVGGRLESGLADPYEPDRNVIYDMVDPEKVDGVLVVSTAIGNFVSVDALAAFCRRYSPRPVVSLGVALDGVPSIVVQNEPGMRQAVDHLIEDHDCRRIAFIRGPEGHVEAEVRYRVYRETLEAHGLPFDPDLVGPGDFVNAAPALSLLLDERGVEFDALIAANDNMALRAMEALRERGYQVPGDVAVVGFDDVTDSRFSMPPLTTVRQPISDMGRRALELVYGLIQGDTTSTSVEFPAELVVRRSCGCLSPEIMNASVADLLSEIDGSEIAGEVSPERMYGDVVEAIAPSRLGITTEQLRTLLDAFDDARRVAGGQGFLTRLDSLLYEALAREGAVNAWQLALSALRKSVLMGLLDAAHRADGQELARVEDLLGQARLMVSAAAQREQALRGTRSQQLNDTVRDTGLELSAAFDVEHMIDALVSRLPQLDMRSCHLAIYRSDRDGGERGDAVHAELPAWSELLLAYEDGERLLAKRDHVDVRFASRTILPSALLPDRTFSYVIEPLTFEGRQIGFVLFEPGPQEVSPYTTLRGQLSSAVQGSLLTAEMERRTVQLQTAAEVSRIAMGTLEREMLLQDVVELVRERLWLYYAGVFLVDESGAYTSEPGRWAVLQAGTGEAGRQMVAQRHRLEVSDTSMVGWAIEHREARIALDVSSESVRQANPLLPETRSEMALPIVGRAGESLGALTIQSERPRAFSEEDVTVLQVIADQLGSAIESVNLLQRTQAALRELEATQRRYQQQAWSDYLTASRISGYEVKRENLPPLGDEVRREIEAALERQAPTTMANDAAEMPEDGAALVVPITHRSGAVMGALGIHDDPGREWTDDEIALIQAVVERMGLAAENLRLLDETQRRVAMEQLTQDITGRMRQSLDVEQVLRAAVEGFVDAFDVDEVHLRLVDPRRSASSEERSNGDQE